MNRRKFITKTTLLSAGTIFLSSSLKGGQNSAAGNPVRLGGPVFDKFEDPSGWIKALKSLRYSAAYCPLQPGASFELIKEYSNEAKMNNIIISEVGVWNNIMDPDEQARKSAIDKNIESLRLADQIGACCCVNISGAKGEIWDGPYPGNYTKETFDQIVETVRYIIDQVMPVRTYYTLEPMPYMLPDSPDTYIELIKAINRERFAVHLDPVNMISNPRRYFNNGEFIKECFTKLGPYIRSVHAKDIILQPKLTVHLEERRPGAGFLDYGVFLQEMSRLKDVPLMLEHLETREEYTLAAEFVRNIGEKEGMVFL